MRAVIVTWEGFRARRRRLVDSSADFALACVELIDQDDGPYVTIGDQSFRWECPGCGHAYSGELGPLPEKPNVWTVTGPFPRPTLTPSLGCPRWQRGECPSGHWILRNGELIPA